jgi:hypothetical protein
MKTYFLFSMNGAGIKGHNTFDPALRQARQWKASHIGERVAVEELTRDGNRLVSMTRVEIPMLIPALTPRHDFEDGSKVV